VAQPRENGKGEACPAKPSEARAKTDWRERTPSISSFECRTAPPSLRGALATKQSSFPRSETPHLNERSVRSR